MPTTRYLALLAALLLLAAPAAHGQDDHQALYTLGAELFQAGKYAEADSVLRLYLASKGDVRDTLYADGLTGLALALEQQGKHAEALPYLRTCAKIYLDVLGDRNPSYAFCLNNIALNLEYQGFYDQAEPLFRQAVEIRKELHGDRHPRYAQSLYRLAINLGYLGRHSEAEPLLRQALEILQGELHPEYADVLATLAYNIDHQGRYAEAEALFQQAVELDKITIGESHPNHATLLNNFSINLYNQGRYAFAVTLIRQVIEIRRNLLGNLHPDFASSIGALGMYLTAQGSFTEAEIIYLQALELQKKIFGDQHPDMAVILNNLAYNLNSQGRYLEAETQYRLTLAIDKEFLGEQHRYYATGLANLAHNLNAQGRFKEAEPLHRRALEIYKEVLQETDPDYAASLDNLALNLGYQGRYVEAETLHLEALRLYLSALGDFHPYVAKCLTNLATNKYAQGRYTEAEPLLQEALEINKVVLGERHPTYATSLNNLANTLNDQGRYTEAEPLFREGLAITFAHYTTNQEGLSEAQRQQLYETGLGGRYRDLLTRCAQRPEHATPPYAWGWHLNLRGLQLQTSARLQALVATSGDTTLQAAFAAWRSQREYLAALYNLTKDELARRRVDLSAEETKATELERTLSGLSAAFRAATDTTRITWQQVAALTQPNQGVVDLARYSTDSTAGYLAFLYRHGWDGPRTVVLPNAQWLEGTGLTRYRRGVNTTTPDPSVYARFWAPLDSALGPVERVYLAVDGVYNQLNVNTLQRPSGRYILEETEVVQLGSFRDLILPPARPVAQNAAWVVGRPAYRLDSTAFEATFIADNSLRGGTTDLVGGTWADLPGTEREARAISEVFTRKGYRTTLLLGVDATETTLKAAPQPRVLHVATHGFFVPKPENSGKGQKVSGPVVFRSGTDDFGGGTYNFDRDPLLRSGIVLAGVSNAATDKRQLKEDGVLTAYEAGTLNLQGTELVVLSACETGLGEVQAGEGIYGLQRSIQLAGASSVLTSLWRVDDTATQLLMTEFYGRWLAGKTKRQAFAEAQALIRAQYPEPLYWGAFVLVGE